MVRRTQRKKALPQARESRQPARFTQGTARRTNELRQAAAGYSARHAARHAAPCVDAPRPSATWATAKTLRTMIEDFVDAAAHDLFEGCIEEFDGLRVSFSEPAVLYERVAACWFRRSKHESSDCARCGPVRLLICAVARCVSRLFRSRVFVGSRTRASAKKKCFQFGGKPSR